MTTPAPPRVTGFGRSLAPLALLSALLLLAQMILGFLLVGGQNGVEETHKYLGMAVVLVWVVIAAAAFAVFQQTKDPGVLGHAGGVAVLVLAQFALGEMGLKTVHIVLGIAIVAGALALVPVSRKHL